MYYYIFLLHVIYNIPISKGDTGEAYKDESNGGGGGEKEVEREKYIERDIERDRILVSERIESK